MRVIAGIAKGHRLEVPRGRGTRPTSERVREALFSSLQDLLPRSRVADLYAGSGALGIEALSRGATSATFVEQARAAHRAVRTNLEHTGLADRGDVVVADVRAALRAGLPGPFDVAFLDPPYGIDREELSEVLELLVSHLAPGAVVVIERGSRSPEPAWPPRLRPEPPRRYGDTTLHRATFDPEDPA